MAKSKCGCAYAVNPERAKLCPEHHREWLERHEQARADEARIQAERTKEIV